MLRIGACRAIGTSCPEMTDFFYERADGRYDVETSDAKDRQYGTHSKRRSDWQARLGGVALVAVTATLAFIDS